MSETEVPPSDEAQDTASESLPLDAWHRAHGGRMVPFAGYEMPIQYAGEHGGIIAEHNWTRQSASLFDVSHMGQLVVSGEGATAALEALLPGDFSSLEPGNMRYSLLLDESGGITDDLIVTNISRDGKEEFYIVVNGACKWDDIAHMREHLPDDIVLNYMDEQSLLALQGPQAAAVLGSLFPGVADGLSFMQSTGFEWDGVMVGVGRSGYTGEDGFEINCPSSHVVKLADMLVADDRVHPAGLGARDSLRLEAGLPLYGHDLTTQADPVSAGLLFALTRSRRESGGWMGHGPVSKVLADGPAQKRVGLALQGRMPAREGAGIFSGDKQVGTLTSGGFSPTLGYPIAMGYVDTPLAAKDTALEIEVRGKRLPAIVTPLPFVPTRYHRKGA